VIRKCQSALQSGFVETVMSVISAHWRMQRVEFKCKSAISIKRLLVIPLMI